MKCLHARQRIHINGIVQGVGFRPFVYRLAHELGISGFINNGSDGVLIEAEGNPHALSLFRDRLKKEAPPLALITEFSFAELPCVGDPHFSIHASDHNASPLAFISPDVATCEDCLRELFDPKDRRYRYPFINCTNCGPRYTIVKEIPYDRPNTSMDLFPMCPACLGEYRDPINRRFHAQPNACAACGPRITLHNRTSEIIATPDPLGTAVSFFKEGRILAIRGLGGFHLAADAFNEATVQALRRRKGREEKPFALMAPHLDAIRRFCLLSPEEEQALLHFTRPIVLLRIKGRAQWMETVAPGNKYLGFMLPYTPLHHLLLRGNFEALIMTSGNLAEEPIATGNAEAIERLKEVTDYFLLHNREILQRCDDSIVRVMDSKARPLRRSRGFIPKPIFLPNPVKKNILACGGELKNTIALSRDRSVFLSQHIGNLDNPAALAFFEHAIPHMQQILEIRREVIAYDQHPEYLSTQWALKQEGLPLVGVQHHHAHLASVMAENGISGPCIGIILDGTGYGTDGTIWGGEVLMGDFKGFDRFAWLEPVPMPGGELAILQPWRMALSYLHAAYGPSFLDFNIPFLKERREEEITVLLQMMDRRLNSPLTSSCGRLFDAVAALLNIRTEIRYEAQAAVELEMVVDESALGLYDDALAAPCDGGPLPSLNLFRAVWEDWQTEKDTGKVAARFHQSVGEIFLKAAVSAREKTGIQQVGLSGGVFQNVYLFHYLLKRLRKEKFQVLTHQQVPTNDGGLALGQVAIAGN